MNAAPLDESLKFLGTAGARIVVSKQLRASGGLWMILAGKNIFFDPGPGALVKCHTSKPKLDPTHLDAIILSHRHLDHSNDANVMIEAMTEGGYKKKGMLFAPRDALEGEPVIFSHVRAFVDSLQILEPRKTYHIPARQQGGGDLVFETSPRHQHGVETYGFRFHCASGTLCIIPDTRFFSALLEFYRGDILIMHTVRRYRKGSEEIDHLSADDARDIIGAIRPKAAILTHFGMTMLRAKPWEVAKEIETATGIKTIAASDGMHVNLAELIKGMH
jgi:phosphoribosyl 1,2-cyclic phosphodiesterase